MYEANNSDPLLICFEFYLSCLRSPNMSMIEFGGRVVIGIKKGEFPL